VATHESPCDTSGMQGCAADFRRPSPPLLFAAPPRLGRRVAGRPALAALFGLVSLACVALGTSPAWAEDEAKTEDAAAASEPTTTAPSHHRSSKPKREGPNPCNTPDPGFLDYDKWESVALGHMVAPKEGSVRKDGGFDLVVHFHGHEAIRKEFVKTGHGVVLVGIDLGIGSGAYENTFQDPQLLPKIIASAEEKMRKRSGKKNAHVRHLALSSWSAGYGAISQILRQPIASKVEGIVLLDSLHAGYQEGGKKGQVRAAQISQFVDYAKLAVKGKRFLFLSHSSIVPPGYASTTEVAQHVVGELGGKLKKAHRKDVLGLEMIDRWDKGKVHVRGYEGDDKPDHCAHIGLIADVMKAHLVPKWKTPAPKKQAGGS
jgi:hypothetical protein